MSNLNIVNWLKTWMTLALVALWPLMTSHCDLELIAEFSFLACSSQDDAGSHPETDCETDGCEQVEGGLYESQPALVVAPAPLLLSAQLLTASVEPLVPSSPEPTHFSTAPPPDFAMTWQFVCRTALSPRAPSFAS